MKRNFALFLAGCLAISPLSSGLQSMQVFAAEQETAQFSVFVSDDNDYALDEGAEYPLTTGETRNLKAAVGGSGGSASYFVVWSSETPEIVSIDGGGSLTALSSGIGQINLDILGDYDQYSFCYTVRVSDPEPEEEMPEEDIEEAAEETVEDAAEEADEETVEDDVEEADEAAAEEAAPAEATAETEITSEIEVTDEADAIADTAAEAAPETETASEIEVTDEADAIADTAAEAVPETETTSEIEATDEAAATVDTAAEAAPESETSSENEPAVENEIIITEALDTEALPVVSKEAALAAVRNVQTGWVNENGAWSYIKSDGTKATGFLKLGDSTFFLNPKGVLRIGWIKKGTDYYYADAEGRLLTGWQKIGGYSYYFTPATFARKTGICKIGNKLYAFDKTGKQQTGPKWYDTDSGRYLIKTNGTLQTGWLLRGGKWYYFGANGVMRTGKYTINGKIYFFTANGVMRTGWYRFSVYNYYLSESGEAVKGWQTIDGKKYFFDRNCLAATGWLKNNKRIYYFDSYGRMKTGITTVDGKVYYLRADGIITSGWKKVDGKWYYIGAGCKAVTGWLELDGQKYHLARNGVMDTGYTTIGGVRYHFGSDGALIPSTNSYSNTDEFIACIAPLVKKYAPQWNVKVYSPIIAQAILESASGQSSLGKKYNNFFGLKCGTLWTGPSVNLATGEEYTPGTYTTIYANFRVFDNMEEGVKGYFEFLFKDRTRYNNLIGETDPYRYLEKIKEDGYATSSKYVENTYNVIKSYNLFQFDD